MWWLIYLISLSIKYIGRLGQTVAINETNRLTIISSLKMKPKTKGLKHQQQQHKKLLAAMLSQDSFDSLPSTTPSVTEEDIDNEDDAMELLGKYKT